MIPCKREKWIGLDKSKLDTPCLVIDKNALKYNLSIMQQHAKKFNIHVRPHCKTHKCSKLALLQLEYGAIGISAAKLSEAEGLISKNIKDILITSPVVTPYKLQRLAACIQQAPHLLVVADCRENILALNQLGQSMKRHVMLLLDIDAGIGRTGVDPNHALNLGRLIHELEWVKLQGIQCYAGHLQHTLSFEERRKKSLQVMEMASQIVREFKENQLPCSILSGSGTGTFDIDVEASEVTEIQPGSYAVMDVEYGSIGSREDPKTFSLFKPAMTLLTTVISSNRKEHVTVDAGTKSIYVNTHKPRIISHKGLQYDWGGFGDEHGKIISTDGTTLPINGDVLELIVPHCDPTINLFDTFFITENDTVVDVWDIDLRGKSQ